MFLLPILEGHGANEVIGRESESEIELVHRWFNFS